MARFSMNVSTRGLNNRLGSQVESVMKDAITDVTLDLQRVASASAPHDSGFLEGNSSFHVGVTGGGIEGLVGFSAENRGFDYAQWTHDNTYNLGEKSARKPGGRSRFGGGGVPVGTHFLKNALEMNRTGYRNYLQEKYREALAR